jgi:pimeloyl-ACP methyl ester carboxylesterase
VCEPVSRTYRVGGIELAGDELVPENPVGTSLLLHGGGQTRHSWKGAAAALCAAGWMAVTLDARGHGDSGWAPDGDYSMGALASDLAGIARRYGQPVLIGASMGGLTSLVAVGEGLLKARGLVLVDVTPRIEPSGAIRIGEFMRAHVDGFSSLAEVSDAVSAYNPRRKPPASLEGLRKNVRLREDGRWHWHWDPAFIHPVDDEPSRTISPERLRAAARAVRIPTLLVRGAESDIVSDDGVREFLELVPGSRYVDVGGAGHMVAGDDNDVFTREVLRFLDGLPVITK